MQDNVHVVAQCNGNSVNVLAEFLQMATPEHADPSPGRGQAQMPPQEIEEVRSTIERGVEEFVILHSEDGPLSYSVPETPGRERTSLGLAVILLAVAVCIRTHRPDFQLLPLEKGVEQLTLDDVRICPTMAFVSHSIHYFLNPEVADAALHGGAQTHTRAESFELCP